MTLEEFVKLPFNKQVHLCCCAYVTSTGQKIYINKKMSSMYFQARAYLMKQPRQIVKNIYLMLLEGKKASLYDLEFLAKLYVEKKKDKDTAERMRSAQEGQKEVMNDGNTVAYKLDLEGFLGGM